MEGRGGQYLEDCAVTEAVEDIVMGLWGVKGYAVDPETAKGLWALTETLVGQEFPPTLA